MVYPRLGAGSGVRAKVTEDTELSKSTWQSPEPDEGITFVREIIGGVLGRGQSKKGKGDDPVDEGTAQDCESRNGGAITIKADRCPADRGHPGDLQKHGSGLPS